MRWIRNILTVLIVVFALGFTAAYLVSESNLNRTYSAPQSHIAIPTDSASIRRGEHLSNAVSGCVGCHGVDLGGSVMFEDPPIGRIVAANLTRGKGGIGESMTDEKFVAAIRYGVRHDGRSVWVMPSENFSLYSDRDLAALIAYVKSRPAVNRELSPRAIGPMGRVLNATGQLAFLTAARVERSQIKSEAPAEGVTLEYGKYLAGAAGCNGCHGPGLSGGKIVGTPPDFLPAPNLTASGEVGHWSEADFIQFIRSGRNPAGRQIDAEQMPWKIYKNMKNNELAAIWLFVHSVPARAAGTR